MCQRMNNARVAALIDVGWKVSGLPTEGLRSRPKPQRSATPTSKGVVWTRSCTNTNSLSRTKSFNHTHISNTHVPSGQNRGFLGPGAGTHRELCAGRWGALGTCVCGGN